MLVFRIPPDDRWDSPVFVRTHSSVRQFVILWEKHIFYFIIPRPQDSVPRFEFYPRGSFRFDSLQKDLREFDGGNWRHWQRNRRLRRRQAEIHCLNNPEQSSRKVRRDAGYDFMYRQTGRLGTFGANRDRVPQPIGIQMKSFFQLRVSGEGQDKKLKLEWHFYLYPSWFGNSVPIHPARPESPRLMVPNDYTYNTETNRTQIY